MKKLSIILLGLLLLSGCTSSEGVLEKVYEFSNPDALSYSIQMLSDSGCEHIRDAVIVEDTGEELHIKITGGDGTPYFATFDYTGRVTLLQDSAGKTIYATVE